MHVVTVALTVAVFSLALAYVVSSRQVRRLVKQVSIPLATTAKSESQRLLRRFAETRRPGVLTQRARQRAKRDAQPAAASQELAALDTTAVSVAHLVGVLHAAAAASRDGASEAAIQLRAVAKDLEAAADGETARLEKAVAKVEAETEDELVELYLEVTCLEEECKQRLRAAVAVQHARAARRLAVEAANALSRCASLPPGLVDLRSISLPPIPDVDASPYATENGEAAAHHRHNGLPTSLGRGTPLATVAEHAAGSLLAPPLTPPSPSVAAAGGAAGGVGGGQTGAMLMRASEMLRLRRGLPASTPSGPGVVLFRGHHEEGMAPLFPTSSLGADVTSDESDGDGGN